MLREIWARYRVLRNRLRRFERRELRELHGWIEETGNLLHLSVLLFVPLLIGLVTLLSNAVEQISFLLFPPLASGTYMLFANPEGRYASPWRFVAGLTAGAVAGWVALEVATNVIYDVPSEVGVHAGAAALGVFLTGVVTWGLDLEEPAAFSTALLVLVTGTSQLTYVLSVALSSGIVAAAFVLWRDRVYERRAEFLYGTTRADDHVLVPMRGDDAPTVALFAAHLAAAHDAGKVVLLGLFEGDRAGENDAEDPAGANGRVDDLPQAAQQLAEELEGHAGRIEERVGVPCEVIVAAIGRTDAGTVIDAAEETNCDLIVAPYEAEDGRLPPFIRGLFAGPIDVVALRLGATAGTRPFDTQWQRIMVPVRRPGEVAHAMLDFANRLCGTDGSVAVCHCIATEGERREAETMLANLVETFDGAFETRVARTSIEAFLAENAASYDLTLVGSSTDRTAASRFVSPPTFRKLGELDCDVGVVHRG